MLDQKAYNWSCVWTGDDDSEVEDWIKAWQVNVEKAHFLNNALVVVAPRLVDELDRRILGRGQSAELALLDELDLDYTVVDVEEFATLNLMNEWARAPSSPMGKGVARSRMRETFRKLAAGELESTASFINDEGEPLEFGGPRFEAL